MKRQFALLKLHPGAAAIERLEVLCMTWAEARLRNAQISDVNIRWMPMPVRVER